MDYVYGLIKVLLYGKRLNSEELESKVVNLLKSKERLRFDLAGESGSPKQRIKRGLLRSEAILNHSFKDKALWLRIILWDDLAKEGLKDAGLDLDQVDNWVEGRCDNEHILYIQFEKFIFKTIRPIINAIINYDLGFDPASNISCYFISFDIPLILNIYDDRGLDILTFNEKLYSSLKQLHLR